MKIIRESVDCKGEIFVRLLSYNSCKDRLTFEDRLLERKVRRINIIELLIVINSLIRQFTSKVTKSSKLSIISKK